MSSLTERVEGVGVAGGTTLGVSCGLLGGLDGGEAGVVTTREGLEPGAAACWTGGKAEAAAL